MFRYVFRYGGYGDARVDMVVYVWVRWVLAVLLRCGSAGSVSVRMGKFWRLSSGMLL